MNDEDNMESRYRLKIDEEKQQPIYVRNSLPLSEDFSGGNSVYAKLQRFAGKYHIEQRGIERVPENERTDKSLVIVGTMVCHLRTLPIYCKRNVLMKLVLRSGWLPI